MLDLWKIKNKTINSKNILLARLTKEIRWMVYEYDVILWSYHKIAAKAF